jgi:hypothetical protein
VAATEGALALDPVISERVRIAQPGLHGRVLYMFSSGQHNRYAYELLGLATLQAVEQALF